MDSISTYEELLYHLLRKVAKKLLCSTVLTGLLSFILLVLFYNYIKQKFEYWKVRKVHHVRLFPLISSMMHVLLLRTPTYKYFAKMYFELENHDYGGIFHVMKPALLIRDPSLIQKILVIDYIHFFDRVSCVIDRKCFPLSNNLYSMQSNSKQSRILREKLSPLFTANEVRKMFHNFISCSTEVNNIIMDSALKNKSVELQEISTRFTTDVFGLCAFGLNIDSLKNPDTKIRKYCRQFLNPSYKLGIIKILKLHLPTYYYGTLGLLLKDSEAEEFFLGIIKAALSLRRRSGIIRNDMLQYLLNIKYNENDNFEIYDSPRNDHGNTEFSDNDLAAQCYLFFLVASELTSRLLSFCLYELALNSDIQSGVHKELCSILKKHSGIINYEAVQEMKYMDKVISETLRKYPPMGVIHRICTKPYTLPGASFELEKGIPLVIPVYAIHHDSKYYPQPEKFDPERFSEENINSRPFYSYLPYGGGPRGCLGVHFSQVQAKVCLALIVSTFQLEVCSKTSIPLNIEPKALFMNAVGGVWLNFKLRSA